MIRPTSGDATSEAYFARDFFTRSSRNRPGRLRAPRGRSRRPARSRRGAGSCRGRGCRSGGRRSRAGGRRRFGSRIASSLRSGRNELTSPGMVGGERGQRDQRRAARAPRSRPRARGGGARASGGSGTARSPGTPGRGRGSRCCAPPPRSRRPTARGASRAPSRSRRTGELLGARCGLRELHSGSAESERAAGADVSGRRPHEPAEALLLEDVGRPARGARAGEHRRRELRRHVRDVEHDRRPELDVRREHAVGLARVQLRERDALELLRDLEPRRAELLRGARGAGARAGPRPGRRGDRSPSAGRRGRAGP